MVPDKLLDTLVANLPGTAAILFDDDLRCVVARGPLLARLGIICDSADGQLVHEKFPAEMFGDLAHHCRAALDGTPFVANRVAKDTSFRISISAASIPSTAAPMGVLLIYEIAPSGAGQVVGYVPDDAWREVLFERPPDLALIVDRTTGRIEAANHTAATSLLYPRSSLVGKSLAALFPADQGALSQSILRVGPGDRFNGNAHAIVRADQTTRLVDISAELVPWADDSAVFIRLRDVTERHHTAYALQKSEQALRRKIAELEALYHATSVLFNAESLEELAQQIVEAVVREFDNVYCGLVLVEKDAHTLRRVARAGSYVVQPSVPLNINGPGLIPVAVRSGNLIYVPRVADDGRYVPGNLRTQSELVVPLHTGQKIVGALDLQSPEVDAFSQQDQYVIWAFAERSAVAIENIRLNDEVRRYAADLENLVSQRTAQLHRITERVLAILNNSSDGIVLARTDGSIRQVNPAFEEMFGYQDDKAFGESIGILADSAYRGVLEAACEATVNSKQPERLELIARRADGTTFNADVALSFIPEDHATGIVGSFRDVTEHKKAEEALRATLAKERELNELKSLFVSMISHEFRTPLTAIQMSTNTLERYIDRLSPEKRAKRFNSISKQIKHMVNLLEDVLLIGRAEAGRVVFEPVPVNFYQFCQEIVEDFRNNTDQDKYPILYRRGEDEVTIQADEKLLRQIITNLLSNAIKYSPEGGQIVLDAGVAGDNAVLSVRDQGLGIPDKDQQRLFIAFHRAVNVGSIPGTGLGLLIAKHAVEAHSGSIEFESELNVGTTFVVKLPIRQSIEFAPGDTLL
ncbi:MAG: PAS domain S-box protein [Chloroflexi bacterium]|nr:PAS domain S-box protein [Chloroflexota bacterium]